MAVRNVSPMQFARLPKSQQRVQIALDVILQIKRRRFSTNHSLKGYYLQGIVKNIEQAVEIREMFAEMAQVKCCAIGAVFVSAVSHGDTLEKADFNEYELKEKAGHKVQMIGYPVVNYLENYFEREQLRAMEQLFESWKNDEYHNFPKFAKYLDQHADNKEQRIIAIMRSEEH